MGNWSQRTRATRFWKRLAPMANRFPRSAISRASAPSERAASAWSNSPAPIACSPHVPRPSRTACRSRPPRQSSSSIAAWLSSCCWWSATTSVLHAFQTATASCRRWRSRSALPMFVTPTTTRACLLTCRIRASCSTTIAAFCAPAACASAPRSKERTCGRSPREASTPASSATSKTIGDTRATAPVAANACKLAQRGRWRRRDFAVHEMVKQSEVVTRLAAHRSNPAH